MEDIKLLMSMSPTVFAAGPSKCLHSLVFVYPPHVKLEMTSSSLGSFHAQLGRHLQANAQFKYTGHGGQPRNRLATVSHTKFVYSRHCCIGPNWETMETLPLDDSSVPTDSQVFLFDLLSVLLSLKENLSNHKHFQMCWWPYERRAFYSPSIAAPQVWPQMFR